MGNRSVCSGYAFDSDYDKKSAINKKTYEEIKDMAKLEHCGNGYGHSRYRVTGNPENLSSAELALIADKGNLCFGYRTEGDIIVVHTD